MKILRITALLLLAYTFQSCDSGDEPFEILNRNYLDYQIFYDSDENITSILVEVKNEQPSGNNLELNADESITFREDALMYDENLVAYTIVYEGLISEGDFVYSSSEGKNYTSTFTGFNSVDFPRSFTSISKQEGPTVEWEGSSLGENEAVTVVIGEFDGGQELGTYIEGEGISSFQIVDIILEILPVGMQPAYMKRSKVIWLSDEKDEVPFFGGRIGSQYRSKTIQVEVTE